jgi:hypothetical protein
MVRSMMMQGTDSGACAVRYFLVERHPDLASTALRWVESVVVFTHPLCRLEVNHAKTTVSPPHKRSQSLRRLAGRRWQ